MALYWNGLVVFVQLLFLVGHDDYDGTLGLGEGGLVMIIPECRRWDGGELEFVINRFDFVLDLIDFS